MKVMNRPTKAHKQEMNKLRSKQKKPPNECFSLKEIEEIMGIHRDTYKRVNGKIKRR